ncbi:MAG: hypothetical protein ACYDBV_13765, partial [Nitrospiria bacterium]
MDVSSAGVTVIAAVLEVIPEKLAVMPVVPLEREVNNPFEADALLTVPVPAFDELQMTREVIS